VTDVRIGVVGTGFISRHFALTVPRQPGYRVAAVLTRRSGRVEYPVDRVTRDLDRFLSSSDVVVECSGDPIHATDVIAAAFERGLPVVTMNAEWHVTVGSAYVSRGLLSEAEGDQPGSQAALKLDAEAIGFEPLVYGNMKGFLNHQPTVQDMEYWAERQGISVPMVTSFTDGTKVQVEQVLVGNGLGASIAAPGLLGPASDDLAAASVILCEAAEDVGRPIVDYVLSRSSSHGVFVAGRHDPDQAAALEYLKQGSGPYYRLIKHSIYAHLEMMKTVRSVVERSEILLDNSVLPELSVAAVAKREVPAGTAVERAIGSFDFRGEAVRISDAPSHCPIGLIQDGVVERSLEPGEIVTTDDVSLPESTAVGNWQEILDDVLASPLLA
jgi:predicted homoserine dehydrogenase-like protein